jgi:hypothetical protein
MKSCTPKNSRNKKATGKPITTVSQNHNQQTIPSAGQFPAATPNSNHASSKSCRVEIMLFVWFKISA